jgi:MinD-like ATPase involved in chromosome partitioning or flagellar assembly
MTTTTPTRTEGSAFAGAARAASYVEGRDAPAVSVAAPSVPPAAPAIEPEPAIEASLDIELEQDDLDLGALSVAAPPRTAQKGLRGLLTKVGVKVPPGAAETAAIEAGEQLAVFEETIRQVTWTRAVSVLVANPKGGVGKTPTSLMLGGTIAAIRGGSVCIIEVSDDPGALTFRSEGSPNRGLGELVADAEQIRSAGQLAGYTAPQSSFAAVIGSVGWRPRLDDTAVNSVVKVVDDYYAVRVMDSGNQPSSPAFGAAVMSADVLVVPIFDAGDAALEAAQLLEGLKAAGGRAGELAANAIVLRLHDGRPEHPQVVARVDRILSSHGITHQHSIPFDAHIAERGQLTLAKLAPITRHALTGAAADVVRTLQNTAR